MGELGTRSEGGLTFFKHISSSTIVAVVVVVHFECCKLLVSLPPELATRDKQAVENSLIKQIFKLVVNHSGPLLFFALIPGKTRQK